jgi:hypothetical protein
MNVALEFGKPKICYTTIIYKVEAWAKYWSINNGHGIAPNNSIEFLLRDYGFSLYNL